MEVALPPTSQRRMRSSVLVPARLMAGAGGFAVLILLAHPVRGQVVDPKFWITNGTVNAVVKSGNTLYIGGEFDYVGPATGGGAPLGGVSGQVAGPFPKVVGTVDAVAPDGSGGWFIGGDLTTVGGLVRHDLAHILADGSVAAWAPDLGTALALAVSGGTVFAGGTFGLVALDATSGATVWNAGVNASVRALVVSGGTLYAGGDFTSLGGKPRSHIGGVSVTTGAATGWNPNATGGSVSALAASGGVVYAGGAFTSIGGENRHGLAAIDITGAATTWNPNPDTGAVALAVIGHTIYAAGPFTFAGGADRNGFVAVDSTTGFATALDPSPDGPVRCLATSGNTLYAGGSFRTFAGQPRNRAAALAAASGALTGWDPNAGASVLALATSAGTVYAAGTFTSLGGVARSRLAALNVLTGVPTGWAPGANFTVRALAASGGTIYVGGQFNVIAGQPRSNIAALDPVLGTVTDWAPNADGAVCAIAVGGGVVYAGGFFATIGGQTRRRLAALDAASGSATSWDAHLADAFPFTTFYVKAVVASGGTVYVGGRFKVVGGQNRSCIAAVDAATATPSSWNPDADGPVNTLALGAGVIYAGGDFGSIGGQIRGRVAAVDAATGAATGAADWPPITFSSVQAVAAGAGVIYVGCELNPGFPPLLAADAMTGVQASWDPGVDGDVNALVVDGSTLFVGGGFSSIGGQPQSGIAALSTVTLDVPGGPRANTLSLAAPIPSPVRTRARIAFTLPTEAVVSLALYDVNGRRVAALLDRAPMAVGEHQVDVDSQAWPAGCYWYDLTTGAEHLSRKLVVVR